MTIFFGGLCLVKGRSARSFAPSAGASLSVCCCGFVKTESLSVASISISFAKLNHTYTECPHEEASIYDLFVKLYMSKECN